MPNLATAQGWLYNMRYSPQNEQVEFTLLKKKVIPVVPPPAFDCTLYANYTFADFEAIPDLSPDIEQCRFLIFG